MAENDRDLTLSGDFFNVQIASIQVDSSGPHSEFKHLPEFNKGIAENPGRGYKLIDSDNISFRYQTGLTDFAETTENSGENSDTSVSSELQFHHSQFQYESWSEAEADVDGKRREVKIPSKSKAVIHWSDQGHLLFQGSPKSVREVEKDLKKKLGKRVNFTSINFNPDFLLWLLSRYYMGNSFDSKLHIEEVHSGSISDKEGTSETIHGNVRANNLKGVTPLLEGVINDNIITRMSAEFVYDDLAFIAAIGHGGLLNVTIRTKDIPDKSDVNPYLVAASEIVDLQLDWNELESQEKYPNPGFFIDLCDELESKNTSREKLDKVIERYSVKRNSGTALEPKSPAEKSKPDKNPRREVLFEEVTLGDALDIVESQKIEAKEKIPQNVDDIAKEVAALSNHKGGALVLGMDDNGSLTGLDDVRETDQRVAGVLTQKIEPPIDVEIKQRTVGGADLLIVIVEEIKDTPRSVDGLYYKRVGTTVQQLSPDELTRMIKERD